MNKPSFQELRRMKVLRTPAESADWNDELDEALRKTGMELLGWWAWQEAVKTAEALQRVETRHTLSDGTPVVIVHREGGRRFDPRRHPDHYQLADLV